MNNIKVVLLFCVAFFLAACEENTEGTVVRAEIPENEVMKITPSEIKIFENRHLEEKIEDDLTGDGVNEIIELYITPPPVIDEHGDYAWDDSHYWQVLVTDGDITYPLFDDHIQFGLLELWVTENKGRKELVILSEGSQLFSYVYRYSKESFEKITLYEHDGFITSRSLPDW